MERAKKTKESKTPKYASQFTGDTSFHDFMAQRKKGAENANPFDQGGFPRRHGNRA